MNFILLHSFKKDFDFFIFYVNLPRIFLNLGGLRQNQLFFFLELLSFFFLHLFNFRDFLPDKVYDLILISHLLFQLRQLIESILQLLLILIEFVLYGGELLLYFISLGPLLLSLFIFLLQFLLIVISVFGLAVGCLFGFFFLLFCFFFQLGNDNVLILKHSIFCLDEVAEIINFDSGVFTLSFELFFVLSLLDLISLIFLFHLVYLLERAFRGTQSTLMILFQLLEPFKQIFHLHL